MLPSTITSQMTAIIAELAITVLGAIALSQGMDGAIFAGCIGALAGLGGYHIQHNVQGTRQSAPKPPTQGTV